MTAFGIFYEFIKLESGESLHERAALRVIRVIAIREARRYCFGRVKLKVLPFSGVLSTQVRPPCDSMIVLTMNNPSPDPFVSRLAR